MHTGAVVSKFGDSIVRSLKYRLGLINGQCWGSSFNKCTTMYTMFKLAEQLLDRDTNHLILIFTGEIAFNRDLRIVDGVTVIGDVVTTILLGNNSSNTIMSLEHQTIGAFAKGVWMSPVEIMHYQEIVHKKLKQVVDKSLQSANIDIKSIKSVLPHNVNIPIWVNFAKTLNISIDKIYLKMIPETSHCFCSDMTINYINAYNEGIFSNGDYILVISIGVGATFLAMVLKC